MLLKYGVRSCLGYAKSFDLKRARSLSNLDLAPHLEFVDLGGRGYANVSVSAFQRFSFLTVRLHPAADYAERKTGRRPNQVSGLAHRCPMEERRKTGPPFSRS